MGPCNVGKVIDALLFEAAKEVRDHEYFNCFVNNPGEKFCPTILFNNISLYGALKWDSEIQKWVAREDPDVSCFPIKTEESDAIFDSRGEKMNYEYENRVEGCVDDLIVLDPKVSASGGVKNDVREMPKI